MEKVKSVQDRGSVLRKGGLSPTKRSLKFPLEVRSSTELAKKFQQIKREKIDRLHERLRGNNKNKVKEVDGNLDKAIAAKQNQKNQAQCSNQEKHSFDTLNSTAHCSNQKQAHQQNPKIAFVSQRGSGVQESKKKKVKTNPACPSMPFGDFNKAYRDSQQGEKAQFQPQQSRETTVTKSLNREKPSSRCQNRPLVKVNQNQPSSRRNREEDFRQLEAMDNYEQVKGDVNQEEEVKITNKETAEGTSIKRTRGKTSCKQIHARTMAEREEVTFNAEGQPIGPTNKVVSDLSFFLGTVARNSTFCPLIYPSWTKIPHPNKNDIWVYANKKFILPNEAKGWVETTVRDAWRRYKCKIRKNHFLKYSNLTERLKHRPPKVPESDFRKLCEYWSSEIAQAISVRNTRSRARQKWRHRMGPRSFAMIRETMRAKENREPTQAEIFVETRKGNKGKQLDAETDNVISQLQGMIENNEESNVEAFQAVFGKEHPGSVRCYGRRVTPTTLKKNAEINAIKKAHEEEVSSLKEKLGDVQDEVGKLRNGFRAILQHCNPGLDMESLQDLFRSSPGDANSGPKVTRHARVHSSTSTHVPILRKEGDPNGGDTNEDQVL